MKGEGEMDGVGKERSGDGERGRDTNSHTLRER